MCPYCWKRKLYKPPRGPVATHCGYAECKRAHAARRKREERARKQEGPAPEPPPVPDMNDAVATPFGEFDTHSDAWLHVYDNNHNNDSRYTKTNGYRQWAEANLSPLLALPSQEILELFTGSPVGALDEAPDNEDLKDG